MNGFTTFLAIVPFFCVAIISAETGDSKLQYGALGLCGLVVAFLCNHIKCLTKKITDLCEKNNAAYLRLSNLLEDRPCLMKDKRIQQ